jgi:hypothetical protein
VPEWITPDEHQHVTYYFQDEAGLHTVGEFAPRRPDSAVMAITSDPALAEAWHQVLSEGKVPPYGQDTPGEILDRARAAAGLHSKDDEGAYITAASRGDFGGLTTKPPEGGSESIAMG